MPRIVIPQAMYDDLQYIADHRGSSVTRQACILLGGAAFMELRKIVTERDERRHEEAEVRELLSDVRYRDRGEPL